MHTEIVYFFLANQITANPGQRTRQHSETCTQRNQDDRDLQKRPQVHHQESCVEPGQLHGLYPSRYQEIFLLISKNFP